MAESSLHLNLADSGATEALGHALALALPEAVRAGGTGAVGAVIHLAGELGAGKTTCVRALLRTLGVAGPVRSPTYTLVETYRPAALTCTHVDLYRVQSPPEVEELGLRECMGSGCLLLVEWPEKGGAAVPAADLEVALAYAGEARTARLSAATDLGADWLVNLGRDTSLIPYVTNLT